MKPVSFPRLRSVERIPHLPITRAGQQARDGVVNRAITFQAECPKRVSRERKNPQHFKLAAFDIERGIVDDVRSSMLVEDLCQRKCLLLHEPAGRDDGRSAEFYQKTFADSAERRRLLERTTRCSPCWPDRHFRGCCGASGARVREKNRHGALCRFRSNQVL